MRDHRRVSRSGVHILFLLAVSLAGLGAADEAVAGAYQMYQCRAGDGRAITIRSEWSVSASPGGELFNTCGIAGSFGIRQTPSGTTGNDGGSVLSLPIPGSAPHIAFSSVTFKLMIAPKWGDPNLSHGWVTVRSGGQEVDDQPLPDTNTSWINRVDVPLEGLAPTGSRSVSLSTWCHGECHFTPWESAQIQQAIFTLVENVAPVVGGVGGSVIEAGPRRGLETLTFDVADADSGVRATTALVDGATVAVDDLSAACHYDDFAPCPTSAPDRLVGIDTRRLAAGAHRLVLRSEDAAGNVALKDVGSFLVAAGAPARLVPTAKLRARYAVTLKPTRTLRWNQRFRTRGRLVALDGRPLAGVRVLATVPAARGRAARTVASARTRRDGSWAMVLRARFPSGRVRFLYVDGHGGGASARLTAKVRAGVRLRAARHVVAPYGRIVLAGRLLGGPVPRRGKVVELQARGRGEKRWITFKTVRSDRRGRFRAAHRLRQGYRNVVYEFRAVSRFEAGYPYESGASAVERVAVR